MRNRNYNLQQEINCRGKSFFLSALCHAHLWSDVRNFHTVPLVVKIK